ncbi:hypothetical protein [Vagococcus salmoninarum]|nr:hypothetical protein [Vagococcus salmoninarum]
MRTTLSSEEAASELEKGSVDLNNKSDIENGKIIMMESNYL